MPREDLETLRALGFDDDELRELDLWEVPSGPPVELAEAYIRRSKKKDTLVTLRSHVRDIVRYARLDGKKIRHVWFEQKSASKAYVRREEFEKATKSVLDGLSKTQYVWKTDRLSRRGMGAVGRHLDDFDKRGARLVSVVEGLDSAKGGRIVFAILSERARDEAKDIALRTKVGGDANKMDGRWPGGVTPFGLECPKGSGKLQRNDEYPLSRRIAKALLDNVTPAEIAEELNSEGKLTRHGKPWRAQGIINLAHSPGWAGLIPDRERYTDEFGQPLDQWERGGRPLVGRDGKPVRCGEGVVTYAEREKILAKFRERSRPGTCIGDRRRGKRAETSLMAGSLRCPLCKGRMRNAGRNYVCAARYLQGKSVCAGASLMREPADFTIAEMWITHVSALEPDSSTLHEIARRWLAYQDAETEARKRDLVTSLDSALSRQKRLNERFYVAGNMEEAEYDELSAQLRGQIEALNAEIKSVTAGADLTPLLDAELLAEAWEAADFDDRRMLIRSAVTKIEFVPARRGRAVPMLDRLLPAWRDGGSSGND